LFFSQAPGVGGGERGVLPVLRRLDDIDLVVVSPAPVAAYAQSIGMRTITLELPRAHRLSHAPRIAKGARKLLRLLRDLDTDLLYTNGTRAIPYAIGAAVAGSKRLLFHHHGLLERGPVQVLTRAVDRWADAIVAPSRIAAAPFRATDKVHIIAEGLDPGRFHQCIDRTASKLALGIDPGSPVVGTLTRPDPTKGMNEFLDVAHTVARSLPHVHFVLAGGPIFPHEHAPYAAITNRARELGGRITITGLVADPVAVYHAMDVFVHLGAPEGFGLTVAEALSCGVPVVAYDWGAIPEVFAGLVTLAAPSDVSDAAARIAALVADPSLRDDYAHRGRIAAEQRFAIEATAAQLRGVIESVTARAPADGNQ
jgi:glycosyltransferase involved in cell wall biosynthesis